MSGKFTGTGDDTMLAISACIEEVAAAEARGYKRGLLEAAAAAADEASSLRSIAEDARRQCLYDGARQNDDFSLLMTRFSERLRHMAGE